MKKSFVELSILGVILILLVIVLVFRSLPKPPNASKTLKSWPPFLVNQHSGQNLQSLPPISLKTIFATDHSWVATLSAQTSWTLITTGDVIPARSVNFKTWQAGDWRWPFLKTAGVLRQADLTFINLETPLITNCPLTNEGMIFCGDQRQIEGLLFAGVDVANLANNHSGNWGEAGIKQTMTLLKDNHLLATGTEEQPIFIQVRGQRLAFLGYNDISDFVSPLVSAQEETIKKQIAQARKKADLLIVAFHWGVEYTDQPNLRQQQLAHLAIDTGADLVIGNHPHWIQPVEIYKNKLIVYAHGNFIFDQMWSQKTQEGVVGRYTFYGKQLVDAEFLPVKIENFGQPHFLEDQEKQSLLEEMKTNSLNLK